MMLVRNVIVETWHPRPAVRSSKRSEPRAQMLGWYIGERRGKARAPRVSGSGRHVPDFWVLVA